MPAYWVARSKINDPVEYKKYTDLVPGIIAKFGGKVMARGGRYQIMEGPDKFHRFVVIEFPTFEQGVACFTSPEYDHAAAFRRKGAGEVETVIVEGGDPSRVDWHGRSSRTRRRCGLDVVTSRHLARELPNKIDAVPIARPTGGRSDAL